MKRLLAVSVLLLPLPALAQAPAAAPAAKPVTTAAAASDPLSIQANQAYVEANKKKPGWITRPSGLQFKIIQNGYGKRPGATDTVTVYYTGTLINHVIFDGTEKSAHLPASFKVNGGLVQGWVEALQLMREGDRWLLCIPANLGYGSRGAGDGLIPPDQTLLFDLTLVSTAPAPKRGEKGYVPDPSDKDEQQ